MEAYRSSALLSQAASNNALQIVRHIFDEFAESSGLLMVHCGDGLNVRWALECALSGDHLIENRAEGKDVAAGILPFAFQLLGRHIRQCANYLGLAGEGDGHGLLIGRHGWFVLSETEIEQLRPRFSEHDVAGLEIAMDDPLAVRRYQRAGNRDARF